MTETINGARICFNRVGHGKDRIVLLHGWGCSMKMMQPVADALLEDFDILLIDFPGHGESDPPPVPWGVPEYADCLLQLLKKTGFCPCSVVAHSFGCRVAAWLAAKEPDCFKRIVFTGAAGIRPKMTAKSQKRSAQYRRLKKICLFMEKIPFLKGSAKRMEDSLRHRFGSADYNALDEEMRKTFVKVINQDLTELYTDIKAPTLLIWGDEDHETPLWMGREMEKMIPDAGLVIFENGSHFAYLEQLVRFNTIIKTFLRE